MSERLVHAGVTLPGTTLHFDPQEVQQQLRHVKYWGLRGVAELRGAAGGRFIFVRYVVHDEFASYNALSNTLKTWEFRASAQRHGRLLIDNDNNGVSEIFDNCTLVGFLRLTSPGNGPLYDVAGTLDGGWFQYAILRFYQLIVDG